MILLVLIIIFFSLFIVYSILLLQLSLLAKKHSRSNVSEKFPMVSVLIAARNEEGAIVRCLEAMNQLKYPENKIEILIGNDSSTDATELLVKQFVSGKNNFRLININTVVGKAKGKANVLAQLAKEAKGEYFFITDADIAVKESWIQEMLSYFSEQIGIVSGSTQITGQRLFDKLQNMEWLYAFGMVNVVSDAYIPVSAVGNNMAISRKAYESTGGYEYIDFSVTEDLALFQACLKKGWKYVNMMSEKSMGNSLPVKDLKTLLLQRRRWLQGALKLPIVLGVFLFLQALFFPVIITTLILFPFYGLSIWILKMILQFLFMGIQFSKAGLNRSFLKYVFIYELYIGLFSIALLLYYLFQRKVYWKGRKY